MQEMRRTSRLHLMRQRDRSRGVVRAGTSDYRDAPFRDFDRDLDNAPVLRERQGCSLAGRSARDEEMNTFRDLPLHEAPKRCFIDLALRGERRDERSPAPVSYTHLTLPTSDLV